jgi:hypoxanthine phosphoribosyltransferase
VRELGAEIARDYEGREPILVGSLKACLVFLTDLSRALPILHALDFVELAGYGSAQMGGHEQIRVLKDLDADISGRDVIVVEDVVDTGLTLNYLVRTFELRGPS